MTQTKPTVTASLTGKWKPYPAYKDSGVEWLGEIPEHWEVERLKFNSYVKGRIGWQNLRSDEFTDVGPYLITGMHFKRGSIDWDACYHITEERYDMAPEIQVEKHDVLVTKDGSIGKIAYIEHLPGKASLNSHLLVIRALAQQYVPRYLYYLLRSSVFRLHILVNQAGSTFFGISQESVVNFPIILPSLPEQQAIVTFLDRETARINALIAKKEQLIELLQEKRVALISHAVTKGLDSTVPVKDSGIEWLGEIPAHWEVKRLKFCLESIEQGWSPTCENRPAEFDEWGVLKVGCVNGIKFNADENKALPAETQPISELEIKPGDVLVSRANTRELLGSASVVTQVRPRLLLCDKLYRLKIFAGTVIPFYLVLVMGASTIRYQLEREATGASSSMQNISQGTILNLVVPLPNTAEQHTIATYLDVETAKIDVLISRIQEGIEKLKEYSTALISAAVTGKIDVREEILLPGDRDL